MCSERDAVLYSVHTPHRIKDTYYIQKRRYVATRRASGQSPLIKHKELSYQIFSFYLFYFILLFARGYSMAKTETRTDALLFDLKG